MGTMFDSRIKVSFWEPLPNIERLEQAGVFELYKLEVIHRRTPSTTDPIHTRLGKAEFLCRDVQLPPHTPLTMLCTGQNQFEHSFERSYAPTF